MKTLLIATVLAVVGGPADAQNPSVNPSVEQSPAWGLVEVDAYIRANRPSDTTDPAADPFAAPAPTSEPSSFVRLSFPIVRDLDGVDQSYQSTWNYDASAQTLTLRVFPEIATLVNFDYGANQPEGDSRFARAGGFATFSRNDETDGGTRQNSYGASVQVVSIKTTLRGILMRGSEIGQSPLPPHEGVYYEHVLSIAPEDARSLVEHLKLEVDARSSAWAPGKFVLCGTSYIAPKIRSGRELVGDYCFLTVAINRVAYIDDRDGSVLREWQQSGRRR